MIDNTDLRTADTGTVDADNPWPGLAAFREADQPFFRGREAVVSELTRLVLRMRLTVLYGVSGLGKTSLLRAGLFPRLRGEHVLPVYMRLNHAPNSPAPAEQVRHAVARAAAAADVEAPEAGDGETLWESFHRKNALFWDARNRIVTPLLVFDQFEELFTLGRLTASHRARTDAFIEELGDLIEGRVPEAVRARLDHTPERARRFSSTDSPCKILLSLREDFLADLAQLRSRIPTMTETMFRLEPMTPAEALQVVEVGGGDLVDHGVAEQIVRFVASARADSGMAREDVVVEPALLSVFCRELNNKRQEQGRATITADLLEGSRTAIISDFYERTMSEGDLDPAVRVFVEEELLTESGFRNNVAEEQALRKPGVSAAAIEALIARRLLRREDAGGRGHSRLELTHDVLTEAVRINRDARRAREAQQRELAERQAREERAQEEAEQARRSVEMAQALAQQEQRAREAAERLTVTRRRQVVWLSMFLAATGLLAWSAWREAGHATAEEARANRALATADVSRVARGELQPLAYLARAVGHDPDAVSPRALLVAHLMHQVLPIAEVRHDTALKAAFFNAPATRVLTLSESDTVRLWDARTGEPVGSVIGGEGRVEVVLFSPDGSRVLTASDGGVAQLYDADTGAAFGGVLRHDGAIHAATFTRDGAHVVTAADDGLIRIWNADSGEHRSFPGDDAPTIDASVDPDGRHLLTISQEGGLALWDISSGARMAAHEPGEHVAATVVTGAAFSGDGGRIIAVLSDGTARLIETRARHFDGLVLRASGPIVSAAFDAAGERVVTTSMGDADANGGSVAHLWDARTGARLQGDMRHADWISAVAFSPDGALLVTGSHDRTARIWDTATGAEVGLPLRHPQRVVRAHFGPEGARVLTVSEDGAARMWDARTGLARAEPLRHDGPVLSAEFSNDGTIVLIASQDRTTRVWDARTGVPVQTRLLQGDGLRIELAAFSADGTLVATTASLDPTLSVPERARRYTEEHIVWIWDAATGQVIGAPLRHAGRVNAIEFSPTSDAHILTASDDHTARLWHARTGQPVGAVMQHEEPVFTATFSPDGSRILSASSASEDGTARLWDAMTAEPRGAPLRHPAPMLSARFSPDGSRVITAAVDGRARLWDATSGEAVAELSDPGTSITWAAYSPHARRILTSSAEQSLLWDSETLTRVGQPLRHENARHPPVFSGDDLDLVATSSRGVWVWDVRSEPALRGELRHDSPVLSVAQSADGRLATGSEDGTARLWDVRAREEVALPLLHGDRVTATSFSRDDSSRLLTLSDDGAANIWDVPAWDVPAADRSGVELLVRVAEAIGGHQLASDGTISRVPDRFERLAALREESDGAEAAVMMFVRWLFADPATRTISPLSRITVPEWIARLLAEGESGHYEAARLFPGHPALDGSQATASTTNLVP